MNQPITTDPTNHQARAFSAQLGALAAENATTSVAMPTRLSTILQHFRQQDHTRQHMRRELNADNFIMAD